MTGPRTITTSAQVALIATLNTQIYDAIDQWVFYSWSTSAGGRAFYDQRRAREDTHHQALRALGNRWVGILHGCLRHGTPYDEAAAWAHRQPVAA